MVEKINKETSQLFVLIEFPEIQKYMEHPDFDDNSYTCIDIDMAYFVDVEWANSESVLNYIDD